MSDLRAIEDWAGALLAKIEPKERRKINQAIARELRRSQQQRIKAQRNPNGTSYAPRKTRKAKAQKSKPLRFIYNGKERLLVSYQRQGKSFTGYDRSSNKIKTFNGDRVEKWLPAPANVTGSSSGLRSKKGRIKQKAMFHKLTLGSRLKMNSTADAIGVAFMARNARIAHIHQYGLSDSPGGKSLRIKYDKRELLGFSSTDLKLIEDKLIEHLGG